MNLQLSCLPRATPKATSWTEPAPMLKPSFKLACAKPMAVCFERSRRRWCESGGAHSASAKPAKAPFRRRGSKLCRGRTSAETARSVSTQPLDGETIGTFLEPRSVYPLHRKVVLQPNADRRARRSHAFGFSSLGLGGDSFLANERM